MALGASKDASSSASAAASKRPESAPVGDDAIVPDEPPRALRVGDRVRVVLPEGRTNPAHGWGSVTLQSVGTIRSIDGATRASVDFPGDRGWAAALNELQLADDAADPSDASAAADKAPAESTLTASEQLIDAAMRAEIYTDVEKGYTFGHKTRLGTTVVLLPDRRACQPFGFFAGDIGTLQGYELGKMHRTWALETSLAHINSMCPCVFVFAPFCSSNSRWTSYGRRFILWKNLVFPS